METQITLKNGITVDKQAIANGGIAAFEVENIHYMVKLQEILLRN